MKSDVLIYTKGAGKKIVYINFDDILSLHGFDLNVKRIANNFIRLSNGAILKFEEKSLYEKSYGETEIICLSITGDVLFEFLLEVLSLSPKVTTTYCRDLIASNFWSFDEESDENEDSEMYDKLNFFLREYGNTLIRAERKQTRN